MRSVVQFYPGPPKISRWSLVIRRWRFSLRAIDQRRTTGFGAVAQLGERLVCNQEATGSIPVSSTKFKKRSMERSILELSGAGIFWLLVAIAAMIIYGWVKKRKK